MERKELVDYLKKLEDFEQKLSSDDDEINLDDLNKILENLAKDSSGIDGTIPVKIKKLHPSAVIPTYSKDGDAGMDLTITTIINETEIDITYGFGIAMEIPKGYVGLVFPRSSIRKYRLFLTNSVGVIDSGYRGEIQATFKKTNTEAEKYQIMDRGAQIMIIPYPQIKFIETDNLSDTERGENGFGSSGL